MPSKRAGISSPTMHTPRLRSSERLAPAVTPPNSASQQESCTHQEAESGLPGTFLRVPDPGRAQASQLANLACRLQERSSLH